MIEAIEGVLAEDVLDLLDALNASQHVIVTRLQLPDLIALRTPEVLIDGRMQMYRVTPDLRHIAPMTIGLGPNFVVGENCDIAIETKPSRSGRLVKRGSSMPLAKGFGTRRSTLAFVFSRTLSSGVWTDCRSARRSTEWCAASLATVRASRLASRCSKSTRVAATRNGQE